MSTESMQPESTEEPSQTQIDRRTAMKAALGGAVAAAAWSAPKIEGLSLSPDYASAASQTTVPATVVNAHRAENAGGSTYVCVGHHNGGMYGSCSDWSPSATTIAIPNTSETFTLNATLGQRTKNAGFTNVQLSGLTNSNYFCDVTLNGYCQMTPGAANVGGNAGNLNSGGATTTLNTATSSVNWGTTCNGSALYIDTILTVSVACTYGTP